MRRAFIHLDRFVHNVASIRSLRPSQKILAYVKSNAYGHGLKEVVQTLHPHVDGFGVVGTEEGMMCRQYTSLPVIVNASLSDTLSLKKMAANHLEPVVFSMEFLNDIVQSSQHWPRIWLKLNSGMNRMGLLSKEIDQAYSLIQQSGHIESAIIMTHLADSYMSLENQHQLNSFSDVCKKYSWSGSSYANSAAILESNDHQEGEWIRPGLLMYGLTPEASQQSKINLLPVMEVNSQVLSVHAILQGQSIGYGRKYQANHNHYYAVISLGYADGLPRCIQGGYVSKDQKKHPMLGNPSMDTVCVYLKDKTLQPGDWVQWIGEDVSLHHLAQSSHTIPYEVLTKLSSRVERHYVREHETV